MLLTFLVDLEYQNVFLLEKLIQFSTFFLVDQKMCVFMPFMLMLLFLLRSLYLGLPELEWIGICCNAGIVFASLYVCNTKVIEG